eukprot:scaffold167169_cov31-Tisochrysis_lutea.AAC.2
MLDYLASAASAEVIKYYKLDTDAANGMAEMSEDEVMSITGGVSPFSIPNGSTQDNVTVLRLAEASFAGAFKSKGGTPDVPIDELPPVLKLGMTSTAPVTYTLMCSEFQIVRLQMIGFSSAVFTNVEQPSGAGATPWLFTFSIQLANKETDPSDAPANVSARATTLNDSVGEGAFGVQQLILDLDTLATTSSASIPGISDGSTTGQALNELFLGAYFDQLKQAGNPVFSYSFTTDSSVGWSPVFLKTVQIQTTPYKVDNVAQQSELSCLTYVGSASDTPPPSTVFPWNWVMPTDADILSGVIAVRRASIVQAIANLIKDGAQSNCWDAHVSLTTKDGTIYIEPSVTPAANPTSFEATDVSTNLEATATAGLEALGQIFNSSDDSVFMSIKTTMTTALKGSVELSGEQLILAVNSNVTSGTLVDGQVVSPPSSYYDKTKTTVFSVGVDSTGKASLQTVSNTLINNLSLQANEPVQIPTGSLGSAFGPDPAYLAAEAEMVQAVIDTIDKALNAWIDKLEPELVETLNACNRWVYPPLDNDFIFHRIGFSEAADLILQVKYR